jgi:hypothetical protein
VQKREWISRSYKISLGINMYIKKGMSWIGYGKGGLTCDQHRRLEIIEIVLEIGDNGFSGGLCTAFFSVVGHGWIEVDMRSFRK